MKEDYQILLNEAAVKISKAMLLLTFSVKKVPNYESNKAYLPDELEPFNALSDRFIRVVETFIKFFRTYESANSCLGRLSRPTKPNGKVSHY